MNLVSVGEVLWDVIGDQEHLGGAPLNFAAHATRLGNRCLLVSAVGHDQRGDRALSAIHELGLTTDYIGRIPTQPTGYVTVDLQPDGQPGFTIHHPAAYDFAELSDAQREQISEFEPNWIYFGTLAQMSEAVRRPTSALVAANPSARCFYDINLRRDSYSREVVLELLAQTDVLKLNDVEIASVEDLVGMRRCERIEGFCRECMAQFDLEGVCVTRGHQGCALMLGNYYLEAAGYAVKVADTIGAGDAFAAGLVHALSQGWSAGIAADFANRVGALVASRTGAIPDWSVNDLQSFPSHS
jgi:fructokinase